MQSPSASSPIELEVGRIRELSKSGRHCEALAAAEVLAAAAPAKPRRPVPDRRQPAMPEPDTRGAGNLAAPGATASAVQPPLPGARLLLHDPAGCAARDRCLSARRGHQPGAGDELEHARTPVSHDGGRKKCSGRSRARLRPETPAARGRAGREPVLGRRSVCGGEHPPGISAQVRRRCRGAAAAGQNRAPTRRAG